LSELANGDTRPRPAAGKGYLSQYEVKQMLVSLDYKVRRGVPTPRVGRNAPNPAECALAAMHRWHPAGLAGCAGLGANPAPLVHRSEGDAMVHRVPTVRDCARECARECADGPCGVASKF
jgi:hypothetical protein